MKTNALEMMQEHYRQRDLAAKKWKAKGGKVAGYFCNVPEEMLLAAGFFPIRISGNPSSGTETADKYTEPFYQPDVRSMFNMLLTGEYDFLDFLVIPHSRDAILSLYHHLISARKIDPTLKLPEIYLLDIPHTRFWQSGRYAYDRLLELKQKLEEWAGKEITSESLSSAIAITNENRAMLKEIAGLRAAEPPSLSGVAALQIIGSSVFMMKDDHNKLLAKFFEEAPQLPPRDGARVFVQGSPIDNLQLYELVESCNATVVGEDNCWGNRYFNEQINPSMEPLEAIADRYHLKSLCPRMHPMARRLEYILQSVIEAKADGVIFFFLEWDNAPAWEYPDQKKVLEEKGIPSICFEMQKYLISRSEREELKTRVMQFIKSINSKGKK